MLGEPEHHRVLLTNPKTEHHSKKLHQGPSIHLTHHLEILILMGKKQERRTDRLGRGLLVLGHLSEHLVRTRVTMLPSQMSATKS